MTARRKGAADTAPRLTPRAPELLAADPALSRMWDLVSSPGSAGLAKILAVGSLVAAGVVVDESGGEAVPAAPGRPDNPNRKWLSHEAALERERQRAALRPTAVSHPMSQVRAEEVRWLWPGRLPRGRVAIIMGVEGKGKSTLLGWLVSTVTAGLPWPDSDAPNPPGSVVLIQAEENINQDMRPRLDAMGAVPGKAEVLTAVKRGDSEAGFCIASDCEALEGLIARLGDVRLVVIDPLFSFIPGISGTTAPKCGGTWPRFTNSRPIGTSRFCSSTIRTRTRKRTSFGGRAARGPSPRWPGRSGITPTTPGTTRAGCSR